MKSAFEPLPFALETVNHLSITKVKTIKKHPIKTGTMIPPLYILARSLFGPLCFGQKPPAGSGFVKLSLLPITKRHKQYPKTTQIIGASKEMMLLDFLPEPKLSL